MSNPSDFTYSCISLHVYTAIQAVPSAYMYMSVEKAELIVNTVVKLMIRMVRFRSFLGDTVSFCGAYQVQDHAK